ncbi:MAG: hypothetical protein MI724_14870, partial [Spirochaetales bacterium]|nr:hypothetical protein [Spirochaetales bacterium]
GLRVRLCNPRGNVLEFGWDEPLRVDGADVSIVDYPRLENRFCRSEYMSGVYHFTANGRDETIDFTL